MSFGLAGRGYPAPQIVGVIPERYPALAVGSVAAVDTSRIPSGRPATASEHRRDAPAVAPQRPPEHRHDSRRRRGA